MRLERNTIYYFIPSFERFKNKDIFKVVFRRKLTEETLFNRIYEFAYYSENMYDLSLSNVFYLNKNELIQISNKKKLEVFSIYKNDIRLHFYPCEIYATFKLNEYFLSNIEVDLKREIINI